MVRWERTVAVVSYALARSKASALAVFFSLCLLKLVSYGPLAHSSRRDASAAQIRYGCIRSTSPRTALANYAH